MDDWFVIANPVAGGSKCARMLPEILELLTRSGISFKKAISEKREHAVNLAHEAVKKGYRKFISIGGDGTANEVVNGLKIHDGIDPLDFTLALIPAGSGNDWGRSVGISAEHESAVMAIKKGITGIQDICKAKFRTIHGKMAEKLFVNVAGAGYDADVLFRTERMKQAGRRGSWLYFYNIFTSLFSYKPSLTTVRIDGLEVIREKALSVNIGIGRYNGGGLMQVPHALLDDGNIAFTFIGDIGKFGIISNLSRLKTGNIQGIKKVQLLKGKKIEINSESPMLFEADGEALGETPLYFEVVPGALRVIKTQY